MPVPLRWNQAATSSEPAPGVAEAMLEGLGTPPPGRVAAIRAAAGRLFGFAHPERVVFTPGATWGMNLAVHGAIRPGERVLSSALEHNALARPLETARAHGVRVEALGFDASGRLRVEEWEQRLGEGADWIALSIASNVLGTIQPWPEICALARRHGARVILDLAQGGGTLPVDLAACGAAYASVSGHKGLHGPRGIGLLFVAAGEEPEPWIQGGTGTEGALLQMPSALPQRLEPGTPNLPGILGLGAAVEWCAAHAPDLAPIRARLAALDAWCREREDLRVLPPAAPPWEQRLPVLSLLPLRVPAQVLVEALASAGLEARAGLMCTSRLLPAFDAEAGVVRLSPPLAADDEEFARARTLLGDTLDAFA